MWSTVMWSDVMLLCNVMLCCYSAAFVMWYDVLLHYVAMWCDIVLLSDMMLHYVMLLCDVTWYVVMWRDVMLCDAMLCYGFLLCDVAFFCYVVMWCHVKWGQCCYVMLCCYETWSHVMLGCYVMRYVMWCYAFCMTTVPWKKLGSITLQYEA